VSNVVSITTDYDPWGVGKDEPRRPYIKNPKASTHQVSFRCPEHMWREVQKVLSSNAIPGIEIPSDLMIDALHMYIERFHETGPEGFSGFVTAFEMDTRQQQSEANAVLLDKIDSTIETLVHDRDLMGMQDTLHDLHRHKDALSREPKPFRDKLDRHISRLEELVQAAYE
jgi:hypothetical protein